MITFRKSLSLLTVGGLMFAMSVPLLMRPFSHASAAKVADGTWSQSASPGTTTVIFDTTGALDQDDTIVLTFPSQATINAAGTDISLDCTGDQPSVIRANNGTDNTITITMGAGDACTGTDTVTIVMTDGLTSYTTTTYAQQSLAINTNDEGVSTQDYGVAMITNDNTTDVTANVPLFVTMAVDTTTISLGTLSVSSVKEADQTYTINSNNETGIQVQVVADAAFDDGNGNDINDVADGTVTAGSEEYGISVDNTAGGISADSPFDSGDDAIPTSAADIASSSAEVSSGTFDINYKASISGTTVAGSYAQVVTVTIATNS